MHAETDHREHSRHLTHLERRTNQRRENSERVIDTFFFGNNLMRATIDDMQMRVSLRDSVSGVQSARLDCSVIGLPRKETRKS
jgi:hypothetical protein